MKIQRVLGLRQGSLIMAPYLTLVFSSYQHPSKCTRWPCIRTAVLPSLRTKQTNNLSSRHHTDLTALMNRHGDIDRLHPRPRIARLDPAKRLQEPDDGILGFGEREILSDADAGPAVEGEVALPPSYPVNTVISWDQIWVIEERLTQPGLNRSHLSGRKSSASSP